MTEPSAAEEHSDLKPVSEKKHLTLILVVIILTELILIGIKTVPGIFRRFDNSQVAITGDNSQETGKVPQPADTPQTAVKPAQTKNGREAGEKKDTTVSSAKTDTKKDESQKPAPAQPGTPPEIQEQRPSGFQGQRRRPGEGRRMQLTPEQVEGMLGRFSSEDLLKKGRRFAERMKSDEHISRIILDRVTAEEQTFLKQRQDESPDQMKKRLKEASANPEFPEVFRDQVATVLKGIKSSDENSAPTKSEVFKTPVSTGSVKRLSTETGSFQPKRPVVEIPDLTGIRLSGPLETATEDSAADLHTINNLAACLNIISGKIRSGSINPSLISIPEVLFEKYSGETLVQIKRMQKSLDESRELFRRVSKELEHRLAVQEKITLDFYRESRIETGVCSSIKNLTLNFDAFSVPVSDLSSELLEEYCDGKKDYTALGVFYLLRTDLYGNLNNALYFLKKGGLGKKDPFYLLFEKIQDEMVQRIVHELELLKESAEEQKGALAE